MAMSRERLGIALGCAGVLLFAGTLPATRLAVGSIDPLFLTAARTTIAGPRRNVSMPKRSSPPRANARSVSNRATIELVRGGCAR